MRDRDPFGLAIEQARGEAGMSLEELGARIGKSSQTVRRYELAEQRPSFQTVEKIAAHLGRSLDYFTTDSAGRVTSVTEVKTTRRRRGGKVGSKAPALTPVDPAVSELREAQRLVRQELAAAARSLDRISTQLRLVIAELKEVSDYVAEQRTSQAMQQQQETAAGRRRRGARGGLETPSNQPTAPALPAV